MSDPTPEYGLRAWRSQIIDWFRSSTLLEDLNQALEQNLEYGAKFGAAQVEPVKRGVKRPYFSVTMVGTAVQEKRVAGGGGIWRAPLTIRVYVDADEQRAEQVASAFLGTGVLPSSMFPSGRLAELQAAVTTAAVKSLEVLDSAIERDVATERVNTLACVVTFRCEVIVEV